MNRGVSLVIYLVVIAAVCLGILALSDAAIRYLKAHPLRSLL